MAIESCTSELQASTHVCPTPFFINLSESNFLGFTNSIHKPNVFFKNIVCFHVVQVLLWQKYKKNMKYKIFLHFYFWYIIIKAEISEIYVLDKS